MPNPNDEETASILAEIDEEIAKAKAQEETAQGNIDEITAGQFEAETSMSTALILTNQTDVAQDVGPSTLDRRPGDSHPVVLLLYNTILDKIKQDPTLSRIFSTKCFINDKEHLRYHIADCIRHGSKQKTLRFYRGPITEQTFKGDLKSLVINTGRVFTGDKHWFQNPKEIVTGSKEAAHFDTLTGEALKWTVDNRFPCDFYCINEDTVPADKKFIQINLPAVIINAQKQLLYVTIVNEQGEPSPPKEPPTGSIMEELNAFIGRHAVESPNIGKGVLEANSVLLKWLKKQGHKPSEKFKVKNSV